MGGSDPRGGCGETEAAGIQGIFRLCAKVVPRWTSLRHGLGALLLKLRSSGKFGQVFMILKVM